MRQATTGAIENQLGILPIAEHKTLSDVVPKETQNPNLEQRKLMQQDLSLEAWISSDVIIL